MVMDNPNSIIQRVGRPGKGTFLTPREFTDRYMVLMKAHRSSLVDETVKDQGLDFLIDYFRFERI